MSLFFIYWYAKETKKFFQKDILILCSLILWALLNTIIIGDIDRGLNKLIPFISGFFIPYFLVIACCHDLGDAKGMLTALSMIAVFSGLLSICQSIYGEAFYFLQYQFPTNVDVVQQNLLESGHYVGLGLFRSRAINAVFLLIPIFYLYDKLRTIKVSSKSGILLLSCIVVLILGIISTTSRTNFFILFLDFIIIFLIDHLILNKRWKKLQIIALVGLAFLSLYILSEQGQDISRGLLNRLGVLEYDYNYGRKLYWEVSLKQLETLSDYLVGIGCGVTGNIGELYEVHSGYIELFVELGIIGFLLWGIFCINQLRRIITILQYMRFKHDYLSEVTIIIIIFINILINNLTGGSFIDSNILLAISTGMITVHNNWILKQQSFRTN